MASPRDGDPNRRSKAIYPRHPAHRTSDAPSFAISPAQRGGLAMGRAAARLLTGLWGVCSNVRFVRDTYIACFWQRLNTHRTSPFIPCSRSASVIGTTSLSKRLRGMHRIERSFRAFRSRFHQHPAGWRHCAGRLRRGVCKGSPAPRHIAWLSHGPQAQVTWSASRCIVW